MPLTLKAGDYLLECEPDRGGSITAFVWREHAVLRPTKGPMVTDAACFPIVPFSNRIANGEFEVGTQRIVLKPNFPEVSAVHPLHGYGWLMPWQVISASTCSAQLEHIYKGDDWPWSYRANQDITLDEGGLSLRLTVTNLAHEAMPAGLGFHPYFPRTEDTVYCGLHRGEWRTAADGLPQNLDKRSEPADWWCGQPISSRTVDTVYTGRDGTLQMFWPQRGITVFLEPSDDLSCTAVYVPMGQDYFCVEPVSHSTDAHNRTPSKELRWLRGGETFAVSLRLSAQEYSQATGTSRRA